MYRRGWGSKIGAILLNLKKRWHSDNEWFGVPLGWFIIVYFVWTALFHLFYVTIYWKVYVFKITSGQRLRIRWLEYATSSTIMFFIFVYLFGHTNISSVCLLSLIVYFVVLTPFIKEPEGNFRIILPLLPHTQSFGYICS